MLADKAYDGIDVRSQIAAMHAKALIPSKRNRKLAVPHKGRLEKTRHQIERCFSHPTHFRRFAAAMIWLR